jgi:hypothetical protein
MHVYPLYTDEIQNPNAIMNFNHPLEQGGPLRAIPSNKGKHAQESAVTLLRFKAGVRPSERAAKAFFQGNASRDWRTLPKRLETLAQTLESWVGKTAGHLISKYLVKGNTNVDHWFSPSPDFVLFVAGPRMQKMDHPNFPAHLLPIQKNLGG